MSYSAAVFTESYKEWDEKQRRTWIEIIQNEQVMRRNAKRLLDEGLDLIFRTKLPPGVARTYIAKFIRWKVSISDATMGRAIRADPKYFDSW